MVASPLSPSYLSYFPLSPPPSSGPKRYTNGHNNHNNNHSSSSNNHVNYRVRHLVIALVCVILLFCVLRKDERILVIIPAVMDVPEEQSPLGITRTPILRNPNNSNNALASSANPDSSTKNIHPPPLNQSKPESPPPPIKQISILGERNSGTRWTYDHVHSCFGHAIYVTKKFTRYKHWFQYPAYDKYKHNTLVLAQFRNPYDWLKAMEHVPHHSPAHVRTQAGIDQKPEYELHSALNDWRTFLTKPWTMPRVGLDLTLDPHNATCQEYFAYQDIVSCVVEPLPKSYYNWTIRYSENQPFYEMRNDGSGLPYDNIMQLRTDKIRNFLSVAQYPGVAAAWVIQYEYLLSSGTAHLIRKIQEMTGVEPQCEPIGPQQRKQKKTRFVTPDFAQYVRNHLNWTVEKWIGYEMELDRESPHAW